MNLHTDSLWIGALIKERIDGLVPVFPCVATGEPKEFCVYRRAGYSGRDTKDRYNYEETVNLMISVVAPTYIRSVELAQHIKDRLDGVWGEWRGKKVDSLTMTNAVEDFNGSDYVQTLYFSIVLDTSFED